MIIAALIVFGLLLAAWLFAGDGRAATAVAEATTLEPESLPQAA